MKPAEGVPSLLRGPEERCGRGARCRPKAAMMRRTSIAVFLLALVSLGTEILTHAHLRRAALAQPVLHGDQLCRVRAGPGRSARRGGAAGIDDAQLSGPSPAGGRVRRERLGDPAAA